MSSSAEVLDGLVSMCELSRDAEFKLCSTCVSYKGIQRESYTPTQVLFTSGWPVVGSCGWHMLAETQ